MSKPKMVSIFCPQCLSWKPCIAGRSNRAKKDGLPLYCGRTCSGLARRKDNPKSPRNPEYKFMKAEYDKKYRENNKELIRGKKAAYYAKTGPLRRDKERESRKKRMNLHVEYCRRPEYKEYKKGYDEKYRAKKLYGAFAEASLALNQLESELNKHGSWQDRQMAAGLFINKSTERKREYESIAGQRTRKIDRNRSKRVAVGYA
jgi:hypothetical protein